MGYYMNPPADSPEEFRHGKLAWLRKHGQELEGAPVWDQIPKDSCAVVCVNNGPFQAIAIAYKPLELQYFADTFQGDQRPKTWFIVSKELAVEHGDITLEQFQ